MLLRRRELRHRCPGARRRHVAARAHGLPRARHRQDRRQRARRAALLPQPQRDPAGAVLHRGRRAALHGALRVQDLGRAVDVPALHHRRHLRRRRQHHHPVREQQRRRRVPLQHTPALVRALGGEALQRGWARRRPVRRQGRAAPAALQPAGRRGDQRRRVLGGQRSLRRVERGLRALRGAAAGAAELQRPAVGRRSGALHNQL